MATRTIAASEVEAGQCVVADDGCLLQVQKVTQRGGNVTFVFEKDARAAVELEPQTVQASAKVKVLCACDYCRDGDVFRADQNCPKCGTVGSKPAKAESDRKAARS